MVSGPATTTFVAAEPPAKAAVTSETRLVTRRHRDAKQGGLRAPAAAALAAPPTPPTAAALAAPPTPPTAAAQPLTLSGTSGHNHLRARESPTLAGKEV